MGCLGSTSGIHTPAPSMIPSLEEQQALPRGVTRKGNNRQLSVSCQLL